MADGQDRREFPRVPLRTEVRLEFADMRELVSEYSANLSLGGMFINRAAPLPVGTPIRFELRVGDAQQVIAGEAVVAWVRPADESPAEQAGMGVRFTQLDDASRTLIFRIVDRFIQAGGEPFEV